jgi:hypothetical protein
VQILYPLIYIVVNKPAKYAFIEGFILKLRRSAALDNGYVFLTLVAILTSVAFFFLVYLHMGRGLYYGSYRSPRALT